MTSKSGVPAEAASQPSVDATPVTVPNLSETVTITHYQQLAAEFMAALDEIATIIPKLEVAHITTANFVRSHQNVPTEFLATAVTAVEQTPELQGVKKLDILAARDTLQFIEAFRPVVDKFAAFAKNLQYTMSSRKASLAADSLQIYYIAKGVARDPNSAAVASLVANMKRDLGRSGRPKVSAAAKKAAAKKAAIAAASAQQSDPQEVKVS